MQLRTGMQEESEGEHVVFRSAKRCRERWNNYMDPNLKKTPYTDEEDIHLLQLVKNYGKKWSEIRKKMVGRNENSVKNRFNALVKLDHFYSPSQFPQSESFSSPKEGIM